MKKILLLIVLLTSSLSAIIAQHPRVCDYVSLKHALKGLECEVIIATVDYNNSAKLLHTKKEIGIPTIEQFGKEIDSLDIIDYNSDTVYIYRKLIQGWNEDVSREIKSKKGAYRIYKNEKNISFEHFEIEDKGEGEYNCNPNYSPSIYPDLFEWEGMEKLLKERSMTLLDEDVEEVTRLIFDRYKLVHVDKWLFSPLFIPQKRIRDIHERAGIKTDTPLEISLVHVYDTVSKKDNDEYISISANSQVSGNKFSLDNSFVNGEHRIAELVAEKNMITDPCEVNRIACAIGDTDMDGSTKDGYGNWFRYYHVPTKENSKAILRVDDESEEEYMTVYDNENHELMVLVAREYGDGADFESIYSTYRNDTIYSCTINGHYLIDKESDALTKPLKATSDTTFSEHYFRTSKHKSTIDNVAGKYTDKKKSHELYLYENGFCNISLAYGRTGQGFWYIDNDSVVCLFEKASINDWLTSGKPVEGEMRFGRDGRKLKNSEFVLSKKRLHTDNAYKNVKWNAFTYHPKGQPINCLGLHSYKVDDWDKMPICYSVYPIKKYTGRTFKLLYSEDQYLVVDAEEIKTMPRDKVLFIKKGELAVHTRNFDGESIHLHSEANYESEIIYTTSRNHLAAIFDIDKGWLYVKIITEEGNSVHGWLEPAMQCPYPFNDNPLN